MLSRCINKCNLNKVVRNSAKLLAVYQPRSKGCRRNFNQELSSLDNYLSSYNETLKLNTKFKFKKNPQDHENDLYFQLGLADHGETGFKFNFEHTYDDVDANSHDLPDGSKILAVMDEWNPNFVYLLRVSFMMRILLSKMDQLMSGEMNKFQSLCDVIINELEQHGSEEQLSYTIQKLVHDLMKEELPKPRKRDTWQVTEAKNELRQIVNNSHHLLTVPDQYRASFVSEWIRLYLEFAAHLKQFPTKHRHLDDRVLHKYGSPSTPYLFHLGNIKKLQNEKPSLQTLEEKNFRQMSFSRDVLGYVHCYANLDVDKKSDQKARDKLACTIMDIHANFFGDCSGGEVPCCYYSKEDYYDFIHAITKQLSKLKGINELEGHDRTLNSCMEILQVFSFQPSP